MSLLNKLTIGSGTNITINQPIADVISFVLTGVLLVREVKTHKLLVEEPLEKEVLSA